MTRMRRLLSVIAFLTLPVLAQASDMRQISWDILAPPSVKVDNPFAALSAEQMDALRKIAKFEDQVQQSANPEVVGQTKALRETLAADGLDVDGLFAARFAIIEQREAAASGVNAELIGTNVRLPGYVVPLEFEGEKVVEFLLVPTAGACIHTPPPPSNQIVHVRYPDGIEVNNLYTAVWVAGIMSTEKSVQTVGYVDGQAPISVSYSMQPVLVEEYGG